MPSVIWAGADSWEGRRIAGLVGGDRNKPAPAADVVVGRLS